MSSNTRQRSRFKLARKRVGPGAGSATIYAWGVVWRVHGHWQLIHDYGAHEDACRALAYCREGEKR